MLKKIARNSFFTVIRKGMELKIRFDSLMSNEKGFSELFVVLGISFISIVVLLALNGTLPSLFTGYVNNVFKKYNDGLGF